MTKTNAGDRLYFHQGEKLVTVKQGTQNHSVFRSFDTPLAEQLNGDSEPVRLLTTDNKGSVLQVKTSQQVETHTFTAYGHSAPQPSALSILGFNGEYLNSNLPLYLLGNGHRSFTPALMRFQSPDSLSPFEAGGINPYCYCGGDPINRSDPTGRSWMSPFKGIANLFGRARSRDRVNTSPARRTVSDPQIEHTARIEGRKPPTVDEVLSGDLELPTYQFVEDHLPARAQNRLLDVRERKRMVQANMRYQKRVFGDIPPHMTEELAKLKQSSLRIRSRSNIDLTGTVLTPNYSTAIVNSAPLPQQRSAIRQR